MKYVFPNGTKAHPGKAGFPINTKKRGRNALSRAAQPQVKLTAKERCQVVQKVCSVYPTIATCKGTSKSRRLNRCSL